MRIRTIKPEFFLHEQLFEAERQTGLPLRLAYIGLWCAADREGRFKWEPRKLGIQILPYDEVDFAAVLHALVEANCVIRYGENAEYGFIPSFKRHQHINQREASSKLPAFDCTETHVHAHALPAREHVAHNIAQPVRETVFARDKQCVRCGSENDLTIDHIFPRSIGGTHALQNLRTLCRSCNSARPVAGQALIDDLAKDGFSLDDMQRMCTHVHARGEGKGKEGNNTLPLAAEASPKKPAEPADPRFKPFLDAFCTEYEKATGHKYAIQGQKDGSQLKRLLKAIPDVQIDEWCHSLEWCRQVAKNDVYAKSCVKTTGSLAAFASAWPQILDYSQSYKNP